MPGRPARLRRAWAAVLLLILVVAACQRPDAAPPHYETLLEHLRLEGDQELRAFRIADEFREATNPTRLLVLPVERVAPDLKLIYAHGIASRDRVQRNGAPHTFVIRWRGADGDKRRLYERTTSTDSFWFDGEIALDDLAGLSGGFEFAIDEGRPQARDESESVAVWGDAAVVSTRAAAPDTRPNILWITVDTVRADHLGAYGYARDTSPFFDALAQRGVFFTAAFAHAPWTSPSTWSMMRSRFYDETESDADDFLPAVLRAHGYETIGWIANGAARPYDIGLTRYFEAVDENVPSRFADWLRTAGAKPFFAYVHLLGAHIPYTFRPGSSEVFIDASDSEKMENVYRQDLAVKPTDEDIERLIRLYDGEILHSDRVVRALSEALDARGLGASTYLVVTSDHGDEFWEHGGYQHGHSFFDELLHVPLVIVPPGRPTPRTVTANVGLVDVAPTLLAGVGIPIPDSYLGRPIDPATGDQPGDDVYFADLVFPDLFHQLRRSAAPPGSSDDRNPHVYGVRSPDLKSVLSPRGDVLQIFDLRADPGETADLAGDPNARARAEAQTARFRERMRAVNASCGTLHLRLTSASALDWTVEVASDRKIVPAMYGSDIRRMVRRSDPSGKGASFQASTNRDEPFSLELRRWCAARQLSARILAGGAELPADRVRARKSLDGLSIGELLGNLASDRAEAVLRVQAVPEMPPSAEIGAELWITDDEIPRLNTTVPNHDEVMRKALRALGYLQ